MLIYFPLTTLGNGQVNFDQTFSFSRYPDKHEAIINDILLKIAEANNRLRVYTSFAFSGVLDYSTYRDFEDVCHVNLRYRQMVFSGNMHYEAFSMEKMLVPDRVAFRLKIYSAQGGLISEQVFHDVEIPAEGDVSVRSSRQAWCQANSFNMEIDEVRFYYSASIFERFESWMTSLNNYYRSSNILEQLPEMLVGLDYDDPEVLILHEFRLCELERKLSEVRIVLFDQSLHLKDGDPESLIPRFKRIDKVVDSLRTKFNFQFSRIDDLYFEKALTYRHADNHERAIALCRQALVYNPLHVSSNLLLASYKLDNSDIIPALRRIAKVISTMFPSGDLKQEADLVAARILGGCFEEVSALITDNRFLDALRWLDEVEQFCLLTSAHYKCPESLVELQRVSHKGMFSSFILVSERAYSNDNLDYCRIYLDNAIDYQQKNAHFIDDRSEAENLLQKLLMRHRELASTMRLVGDETGAAVHMTTVSDLCRLYDFLNCMQ